MSNDIIGIVVTDNSDNVQLNVTPNLVTINVSQTSGNIIGSNYFLANNYAALPATGESTTLYITNDTSLMYRWSVSAYVQVNSVTSWGTIAGTLSNQTDLQTALNLKAPLASPTFTGTVSGITKIMVGLSNVDNTSDVNKPISSATQSALDTKAPLASPTFTGTVSGITKSMVGLSNVDNTSDVNKPVSSATQTALDFKANINNPTFTGTVSGVTKAMVGLGNVDNTTDLNKPISTATQSSLDTKAPIASPTFTGTVSGITKSMVGLGNVDNTTDLLKPISTATQSALNLKYDASNPSGYTTNVGTVTSVGGTGTVSGLSLSGSVTTSGNLTLGGTLSLTSGNVTTALGYTPYNATNPSGYISGITSGQVTTALGYTPENSANKGIANGYASLDGGGLVPSTQLPSYVDDVLEFADLAAFPASGTTGKIYVALDTNKIYRWSGATYIEVSPTVGTIWGGITGTLSNQTDLQNALNTKQNNLSGTGFVKSTAGTISYDTATYYPYPTGDTTQYVGGDGSLISFPVAGQSGTIVRLVRNNTGATLTKGTVIYISGATGNNPVVSKAIATGDATSAQTFGLCQANIANNATGYVVVMGDLIGLDTSAFTEGQQVYLSGTVAGTFTATKQYAPIHLVYIGVITRAHPTLGQIEVKIQNGYELDEIHNVSAQSPANNDIIAFNTSNSLWEKKSIATALGFTPYNATNPNNYIALTALSSSATGLTYTNTTGVFSLTAGYAIPTTASATNWDSAYTNRITSLTTTGSSGASTLVSNVLNIPTYTLSGLGGITATFLSGTSGISYNSTTGVISTSITQYTDTLARASVSLTTTGTSGASTYNSTTGVFNIPNYGSALSGYLPLTGGTLTGALGGTSATFSGQVGITTTSTTAALQITLPSNANATILQSFSSNSGFGWKLQQDEVSTGDWRIFRRESSVDYQVLNLARATGAATFSSSVTANEGLIVSKTSGASVQVASFFTGAMTEGQQMYLSYGKSASATEGFYQVYNHSTTSSSRYIAWQNNQVGPGSQSLVLTAAGNVGIGTSSPSQILDVRKATSNGDTQFNFLNSQSSLAGNTSVTSTIYLGFYDDGTGTANANKIISGKSGDYTSQANANSFLAFATTGANATTERMRITSAGELLINMTTTTTSGVGTMISQGSTFANLRLFGSGSHTFSQFLLSGTVIGSITGSGSVTSYNISSDYRLKEDLKEIKGLEKISAIKVYNYKWKGFDSRMDGVLAHELQEILPYAVYGEKDGKEMQGVDYSKLVPVMLKAIQELSAEITILKNK